MPTRLAALRYDKWQEQVLLINIFKCPVSPFSSKGPEWRRHMKISHTCLRYLVVSGALVETVRPVCFVLWLAYLSSMHGFHHTVKAVPKPPAVAKLALSFSSESISHSRALHRDQGNMSYSND